MILYTTVGTADLARSVRFYDAVFACLGVKRLDDIGEGWAGWGQDYDHGFGFWVSPTWNGAQPSCGNGTMFAFRAADAGQVDAFHHTALAHGGNDEGPPGTRSYYGPRFYVAYVRDPDGNKLACVFHHYEGGAIPAGAATQPQ